MLMCHLHIFFFKKFIYFLNLFLAVLGPHCCAKAFSICGERGLLFVVVRRLFIAVASLIVEHSLQARGLQQLQHVGSRAQAQEFRCTGLVAPQHVGSSRTRARTRVPCIERWILNHCATREVLHIFFSEMSIQNFADLFIGFSVVLLLSFNSSLYIYAYQSFFRYVFFLTSLLEYNCITMLCQFLLYNKFNQLYVYSYPHIPTLLHLPATLPITPLQVVTKH